MLVPTCPPSVTDRTPFYPCRPPSLTCLLPIHHLREDLVVSQWVRN